jgi:glycerol-1-phosphate dehydrogenase [NAD(P)+]
MTAAGYADLAAKLTAGADWIVADALGVEPIHKQAWQTVQDGLTDALADPVGARNGNPEAIERLTEGLMMGGFAMQATMTSRPASGAEHQFSHLWDMQHHTHDGHAPSHGFKVGVATLAVARLYEALYERFTASLSIDLAVDRWPTWDETARQITELFDIDELRDKALEETRAKYVGPDVIRQQLERVRQIGPALWGGLRGQLPPSSQIERMLSDVGAPTQPEEIGISRERLRRSYRLAYHIRRRFTVLDLAVRAGVLDECLDRIFPVPERA